MQFVQNRRKKEELLVISPTVVGVRAQYSVEFKGDWDNPARYLYRKPFFSFVTIGNTVSVSKVKWKPHDQFSDF
jgi:hypothetical protein